jgi:hypothetical protein
MMEQSRKQAEANSPQEEHAFHHAADTRDHIFYAVFKWQQTSYPQRYRVAQRYVVELMNCADRMPITGPQRDVVRLRREYAEKMADKGLDHTNVRAALGTWLWCGGTHEKAIAIAMLVAGATLEGNS